MTKRDVVLTIDVGLTNCKASLFSYEGQMLHGVAHPYPTHSPKPGRSEQDLYHWWTAIKSSVTELLTSPIADKSSVTVISVTAHMHGLIAVDSNNLPLTKCWTLFDHRAEAEATELNHRLGLGKAYHITGARLEAYTPAAKLFWLMRHLPELGNRTHKFLAPKDAIRMLLGGDVVTDPIDAAGSLLYNLRQQKWSEQILTAVGINEAQLPEVRSSTDIAGYLHAEAANHLNLPSGIPIIVGAGDDVETLGAGVIQDGQVLEHIGTTGTLIACTSEYIEDEKQQVEIYPHVVPDMYLTGGATNAAGRSLDWIRKILFSNDENIKNLPLEYSREYSDEFMPFFFPYILGERGLLWNNQATGMFIGLKEQHDINDIARAVYVGVAFSLREILERVKQLGINVNEVISGSSAEFNEWINLRADVYGDTIKFPKETNLTGLGAALLALVATEVYVDLKTATTQCTSIDYRVSPALKMSDYYDSQWEKYREILRIAKQIFALKLDAITESKI